MNEDAKVSHKVLRWHFQDVIDHTRERLAHLKFQLKESHDFQGHAHKVWVDAVTENIKSHLDAAEQFMKEQANNER